MPYKQIFKKILTEGYDIPDFKRNEGDVTFERPDLEDKFKIMPPFETDDLENAGFQDKNTERDTAKLSNIFKDIDEMKEALHQMGEEITALKRTFPNIEAVTKKFANAYEKVSEVHTELVKMQMGKPAEDQKQQKQAEKEQSQQEQEVQGEF